MKNESNKNKHIQYPKIKKIENTLDKIKPTVLCELQNMKKLAIHWARHTLLLQNWDFKHCTQRNVALAHNAKLKIFCNKI